MKYKGMWLDGNPNQQSPNTTRKNKNVVVSERLGSWTNEKGFLKIRDFSLFPNGVIPLNRNDFVVFSTDDTNSEIGLIDSNNQYRVIVNNNQLGFKKNNPIHGEFFINNKNERIITWTDGNKTPKCLNIDNVPANFTTGKLELFNYSYSPNVVSSLEESGSLLTGAYYIALQYVRDDNSTSNWFKNYNPIFLTNSSSSTIYANYSGSEAELYSGKSIRLNLTNVNTDYKYVRVAYIYQANGVKKAFKIKDTLINGTSLNLVITGDEQKETLEIDEIIIDKAIYKSVKHLTDFKGTLYGLDVTQYNEPNQQSFVNNLTFNWCSYLINPTIDNIPGITTNVKNSYKYHNYNNQQRSFCHDEVYVIYIRFKYYWGSGKWWVCSGRPAVGTEKDNSQEIKEVVNGVTKYYKNYQVNDTCSLAGDYLGGKEGTFSYWENENEPYPSTGYYPNGNVRHFKFPSLNWMRNNVYNNQFYGTVYMDILGLKLNNLNLSLFKDSEGNPAIGYEIGYAQRDNNNRVISQSLGIKSWFRTLNVGKSELVSLGGNWSTSTNGYSESGASAFENYLRTYPFELLYTKNNIKANRFRLEYKMNTTASVNKRRVNTSYYTGTDDNLITSYSKAVGVDFIENASVSSIESYKLYEVLNQEYIPTNIFDNNKNNIFGEEHYLIKYSSISPIFSNLDNFNTKVDQLDLNATTGQIREENGLITLLNISTDYYYDFRKQNIINTGYQFNIYSNDIIWGGDSYICDNNFNTYGINLNSNYENKYSLDSIENSSEKYDDKWNGIRTYHRYLCESRYNINLRYINPKNKTYTTYFPNTDQFNKLSFLHIMERDNDPNIFQQGYSKDYHAQNNIEFSTIFDYQAEYNTVQPFRIIRSAPINKEFDINNWRDWRQNDYFEITKNKGKAKNIEANKDFIYIHFERELLRTVGREKFDVAGKNVFIGYGDIFESEPEAIIYDSNGYLGTQHKWSCLSTMYGYVFYDAEKGIWWLISDKPTPISSNGFMDFFRNVDTVELDNPFNAYGIITSFDEEYKRLLITFKNKVLKAQYKNKFKGVWKDEQNFINSLRSGDIVLKDNKYMRIQ